jgi:hypothetical protein
MVWKTATLFLTVAMVTWAIYEIRTERLDVAMLGSAELRPTLAMPRI